MSVTSGTIGQHVFLDNNGTFNNTFLYCDDSDLSLIAVDINNEKASPATVFTIEPTTDAGVIQACDELEEFITFILDGEDYLYANPVNVTGNVSSDGLALFDASQGFSLFVEDSDFMIDETYQVSFMMISGINQIVEYQVDIVLSELGNAGELMIGSFNGTFSDDTNAMHNIDGSFKVIRDF
mgnify:CR=1 FL=1